LAHWFWLELHFQGAHRTLPRHHPRLHQAQSQEAFCSAAKKAQDKLKTLGEDLASGDAGKQNVAIQSLTTYFNQLLAALPANANAAISQALNDAKANVSKGASDPNYQQSITKLNDAVNKQCHNLLPPVRQ
jgi:hypothetical protein